MDKIKKDLSNLFNQAIDRVFEIKGDKMDFNKKLTKKEIEAIPFNIWELAFSDSQKELKKVYLQVCSQLLEFEIFSKNIKKPKPILKHMKNSRHYVDNYIPFLKVLKKQIHKRLMLVELDAYNSRFDPIWSMKEFKGILQIAEGSFTSFSDKFNLAYKELMYQWTVYFNAILHCKINNEFKSLMKALKEQI